MSVVVKSTADQPSIAAEPLLQSPAFRGDFTNTEQVSRLRALSGAPSSGVAEATPANATLLQWARSSTTVPPQEWWDDKTDPFAPSDE